MVKVVKFGGSSLADAAQFRKVSEIILAEDERKYVVPSAPGKRFKEDVKVTDLLYKCYSAISRSMPMACSRLMPSSIRGWVRRVSL